MSDAAESNRQEIAAKTRQSDLDAHAGAKHSDDERLELERAMRKRDVRILRRGTMRGILLMHALLASIPLWLWLVQGQEFEDRISGYYAKYREPEPPDGSLSWHNLMLTPAYHIGGSAFLSVILCVLAWRSPLSSIPPLDERVDGDR